MANQEHLKLLQQGVEVWNQWRKKHAHIQPDLSDADLRMANLMKADLSGALQPHLLREMRPENHSEGYGSVPQ